MHNPKTWIEISKIALVHNFDVLERLVGKKAKVAAVVKANAYGHGLSEVVEILKDKTTFFVVDNAKEAFEVKKISPKSSVFVLGYVNSEIKDLVANNISFVVYSKTILRKIVAQKTGNVARIHIKIETGFNRQGISPDTLKSFLSFIKKYPQKIKLEGIYTHFATADSPLDSTFPEKQLEIFFRAINIVKSAGFRNVIYHAASSAATLTLPKSYLSLVRCGIALYGVWPSEETKIEALIKKKEIEFIPVMTWKTKVAQVKKIKAGESVGYGRSWYAARNSKIAIIPVGYSDGLDRKLSNSGSVIIRGKYATVIGRVAMNMTTIDVTDIPNVKDEDVVVLLGKNKNCEITIGEIAEKIGTISYEILARVNPLLPRIIV